MLLLGLFSETQPEKQQISPTATVLLQASSTHTPIPFETVTASPTPKIPMFDLLLNKAQGNSLHITITNTPTGEKYTQAGYIRDLEIIDCEVPCTTEEINKLIGSAVDEKWGAVRVQDGFTTILYVHSSWQNWGPQIGEIFRRILRYDEDLKGVEICLNDQCYKIIDYRQLTREEIEKNPKLLSIDKLFALQDDEVIWVTCNSYMVPGLETPKLFIQMVPMYHP